MEQRIIFFQGYSPPNISRVKPLWKFLLIFCFRLNPPTVYIRSSWNFIYSYMMMWSSTYYFEVTVHQIFADLCPFERFCKLFTAYRLEVIVCQRLIWAYNIAMLLWCVLCQKALLPRSSKPPYFPRREKSLLPEFLGQLGPLSYSSPNISRDYAPWKFF